MYSDRILADAILGLKNICRIDFIDTDEHRYSQRQAFRIINLAKIPVVACKDCTFITAEKPVNLYLNNQIVGQNAYETKAIILDDVDIGLHVTSWVRSQFFTPELEAIYKEKLYKKEAKSAIVPAIKLSKQVTAAIKMISDTYDCTGLIFDMTRWTQEDAEYVYNHRFCNIDAHSIRPKTIGILEAMELNSIVHNKPQQYDRNDLYHDRNGLLMRVGTDGDIYVGDKGRALYGSCQRASEKLEKKEDLEDLNFDSDDSACDNINVGEIRASSDCRVEEISSRRTDQIDD